MWHDIQQNTEEWLDLRAGKVTGSSIAKVMANYGKAFGEPAKDLAANIAVEQLTGKRLASCNYTNGHMDRGHEEEPLARMLYEETYFVDVSNGGFYDNGLTGCSPDGIVSHDGLIEIKSAMPSIHYNRIRKGGFDAAYKWQLLFNLHESGREWIDFISYCGDFPEGKKLYVYRLDRSDFGPQVEEMAARLVEFADMVQEIKTTICL